MTDTHKFVAPTPVRVFMRDAYHVYEQGSIGIDHYASLVTEIQHYAAAIEEANREVKKYAEEIEYRASVLSDRMKKWSGQV